MTEWKKKKQFYGTQKPFHENQITELRKMRKNFHSLSKGNAVIATM